MSDSRFFSTTKRGTESIASLNKYDIQRKILFTFLYNLDECAGEIQEFKQDLNAVDRGKKKDAVKKVIAGELSLKMHFLT